MRDLGLKQSDNINLIIPLTVITLSGFYCSNIYRVVNVEVEIHTMKGELDRIMITKWRPNL